MIKYLNIFFKKIYKISQKLLDFLIFYNFLKTKKSNLDQYTNKYGFLRIFPEKKSYFKYISKLGNELKLHYELDKSKNIISIGTCFAEQIIDYYGNLHRIEEKTKTNQLGFAADWGRVTSLEHLYRITTLYKDSDLEKNHKTKLLNNLNTFSKNSLISSFRNQSPDFDSSKNKIIIDTSREHLTIYSSRDAFNNSLMNHIKCARKVINNCDTVFITLGQTGYFLDNKKIFYAVKPPTNFMKMESVKFIEEKIESLEKSVNKLEICIENIKSIANNPKFFISLSPVPAFAYFGDNKISTLEYHWYSKSFLYHVINQVVKNNSSISYIPTFEAVMSLNLTSLNDDLRHLKPWFRGKIFDNLFN